MPGTDHTVAIERVDDCTIARMTGAWTAGEAPELHAAFADISDSEDVLIDLRETQFVDSTILTEFVALRKRLDAAGGHIGILASDNAVKRILQITNLDKAFSMNRGTLARAHMTVDFEGG